MRRKLLLAAFLLLGSVTLHAQQSESVPATLALTPRIYPVQNVVTSTYYMLDLSAFNQNIKHASGEKFKINSISADEFYERKWPKELNTQELSLAGKDGRDVNLIILLPEDLLPLELSKTANVTERIRAVPGIPAVRSTILPAIPATSNQ